MQAFFVDGQDYTGGEIPGQVDAVYEIEDGSVRVVLTHEGIIIDRLDEGGNVVATFNADLAEMVELTH